MIPRTKANYTLGDLLGALCPGSPANVHKGHLQKNLRDFFDVDHVLLTGSGRTSLYFILKATDRTRVILPAYTCKAVAEAALLAGKQIEYVDAEEDGFNLDWRELYELVNEDSVVLATHQFGIPCDIERILEIAKGKGAMVVEDAAASFGSRVNGRLTGSFGDAAFFSFDSNKTINVPIKGGFIVAKDPEFFGKICNLYESEVVAMPFLQKYLYLFLGIVLLAIENHSFYKLFHLLNFDLKNRFTADSPDLELNLSACYRYDMADWQACIASKQIAYFHDIITKRQSLYEKYRERLAGCNGISLPPSDHKKQWICTRFPVRVKGDKLSYYRKAKRLGVDFSFSFTFISAPNKYKHAHKLANSIVNLPYYMKLTDQEFEKTVETLVKIDAENNHED